MKNRNKDIEDFLRECDYYDDDIKKEIIKDISIIISKENVEKDHIIEMQHIKLKKLGLSSL